MKLYGDTQIIGSQGEMLACATLQIGEIVRIQHLGGVVPAFDIYAELNDIAHPYPFLVQVKTTNKDYRYTRDGIITPVPDEKLKWLSDRPVPTYVAGYDLIELKMYLAPAFNTRVSYSGHIPVTHMLELTNPNAAMGVLRQLQRDVMNYWRRANIPNYKDYFISQL